MPRASHAFVLAALLVLVALGVVYAKVTRLGVFAGGLELVLGEGLAALELRVLDHTFKKPLANTSIHQLLT